jgi:hypothetical protein
MVRRSENSHPTIHHDAEHETACDGQCPIFGPNAVAPAVMSLKREALPQ